MLTDQDISRMKKVFLTKEDAKIFATKKDLKNFATKADIKTLVTKADHDDDMARLVANMATKEDMRELRSEFQELKDGFSVVMNSVDKILSSLSDLKQEMAFSAIQYARQVEWNHKVAKKVNVPFDY